MDCAGTVKACSSGGTGSTTQIPYSYIEMYTCSRGPLLRLQLENST